MWAASSWCHSRMLSLLTRGLVPFSKRYWYIRRHTACLRESGGLSMVHITLIGASCSADSAGTAEMGPLWSCWWLEWWGKQSYQKSHLRGMSSSEESLLQQLHAIACLAPPFTRMAIHDVAFMFVVGKCLIAAPMNPAAPSNYLNQISINKENKKPWRIQTLGWYKKANVALINSHIFIFWKIPRPHMLVNDARTLATTDSSTSSTAL